MAATLNIDDFREQFPAFADKTAYPDDLIKQWFATATSYINASCVLTPAQETQASYLMTAHLMQLAVPPAAAGGGVNSAESGPQSGPIQSATEGSVSVSFVPPPVKSGLQYWLSSTPYGTQLWALLCIAGAGGFYIGGLPERSAFRKVGGTFR